jgi:hypothetical protein
MQQQTLDDLNYSHDEWIENQLTVMERLPEKVAQGLTEKGVELKIARHLVTRVDRAVRKRKAKKDIWIGAAWCFGGLAISIGTYAMASERGGSYFMAWGAVLFGGFQMIKGLINYGSISKEIDF